MLTIRSIGGMRRQARRWREAGESIGLVPTMGALHAGHVALIRRCLRRSDRTVVSIFVNPTQFGPHDDFNAYPRTLRQDQGILRKLGVDAAFIPAASAVYPDGFETGVRVGDVGTRWEGEFRPGHFDGVATVVLKLFNCVEPDLAIFGQKDYQQCMVIRRMVEDFNLRVKITVAPTVREADGLALSSRNRYLNRPSRHAVLGLYRALQWARNEIRAGSRQTRRLTEAMRAIVEEGDLFSLDYAGFCDIKTLSPKKLISLPLVILIAATCRAPGEAHNRRFIDNLIVR